MKNSSYEYDPNGVTLVGEKPLVELDSGEDAYDWVWIVEHLMNPKRSEEEPEMEKGQTEFANYMRAKGVEVPLVELKDREFSKKEAKDIGDRLGIDWHEIDPEEFRKGLAVELEHRDVTAGDLMSTGKIALAHLKELPDYYTRLAEMELQKAFIQKFIVRRNGKWCVTEDNNGKPGKTIGEHDTRAEAVAQLRAIEANKHK